MKKMYIEPKMECREVEVMTPICVTSTMVDTTPTDGMRDNAPARGVRNTLIVGPKPF